MPYVNNLNFPEYMFAPYLLPTIGDNFGKQKQHEMKELSIPRELIHLFLKKCESAPSHTTLNYLHCALVSMETESLDKFQSKPYLILLLWTYDQTVCFESLERSH